MRLRLARRAAVAAAATALVSASASSVRADEPVAPANQPNAMAPSTPIYSPPTAPIPLPSVPGDTGRFEFGSYGRVQLGSDLRGGTGRDANIVSYGDRIDEDSYAELELRREDQFAPDVNSRVVATLALFPPFFHFTGDMSNAVAVRNLYAQGSYGDWTLWVGSRMYRGDDIYLLDWWPLDNQNTVGGGVGWRTKWRGDETLVALHAGMQRLDSTYQVETQPAPVPTVLAGQLGPGVVNVTTLDRPRTIQTLKLTHFFRPADPQRKDGFKAILYGEAHEISAGVYTDASESPPTQTPLPSDWGWLAGAEVAYWTGHRDTFVQLFVRHAEGLAAYDPLAVPLTFANDRTTRGSTENLVALGGNYEEGAFGVLVGGYLRSFRDGDPNPTTSEKYDEGILALRPQVYIGERFGVALEGAFEAKRFAVLDPNTDQPLVASEWRAGIIPYFSPSGRGSYKRPQLRLVYDVTFRNEGAQELYPALDVFSQRAVEHYAGMSVEWWFNSSSYP